MAPAYDLTLTYAFDFLLKVDAINIKLIFV